MCHSSVESVFEISAFVMVYVMSCFHSKTEPSYKCGMYLFMLPAKRLQKLRWPKKLIIFYSNKYFELLIFLLVQDVITSTRGN